MTGGRGIARGGARCSRAAHALAAGDQGFWLLPAVRGCSAATLEPRGPWALAADGRGDGRRRLRGPAAPLAVVAAPVSAGS